MTLQKQHFAIIIGLISPLIIFLGHLTFSHSILGLLSFGLFFVGWISSLLIIVYLIYKISIKTILKLNKSVRMKVIVIGTSLSILISIGVTFFIHKETSNYFVLKLEKEGVVTKGNITNKAYWNGHMTQAGWEYEYIVNGKVYTGKISDVDEYRLGNDINVKHLKNCPWIRKIE